MKPSNIKEVFIETKYKIEDNKLTLISEEGVGLEEGFNSLLEEDIMNKYYNQSYKATGYGGVRESARLLLNVVPLEDILSKELYKEKIDSELFNKIKIVFDKIYKCDLDLFKYVFDKVKYNETIDEEKKILIEEYKPLYKELKEYYARVSRS